MADSRNNSWTPMKLLSPFQQFVQGESAGGFFLILAALIAFILANSPLAESYFAWKNTYFGISYGDWSLKKALYHWINDGLMAIFFLLVGLEIKRELLVGELSRPKDAMLSVFAALGGMVIPALIYVTFNFGTDGIAGWGIPMATDIAFALGILSLLGSRVPLSLKVFLTALAIVDDLGAVLVIALFYTAELNVNPLILSLLFIVAAFLYGKFGGRRLLIFSIIGVFSWYFMLKSGVHATVAGVLLAFTIPMKRAHDSSEEDHAHHPEPHSFEEAEVDSAHKEKHYHEAQTPLHIMEHGLQPWVAFAIMPIFAFTNAGVSLGGGGELITPITIGCFVGLIAGKAIGVFLFSWLSIASGIASIPEGVRYSQLFFIGLLAGIGFTMSFFIAALAFGQGEALDQAKIGILAASIIAAISGLIGLAWVTPKPQNQV